MTDSLGIPVSGLPRQLFEPDQFAEAVTDPTVVDKRQRSQKSNRPNPRESGSTAPPTRRRVEPPGAPVLLLTVEEAARALSIGRSKTYELIADGALEAVHIGRSTRVSVDALHDLLDRLRDSGGEG